MRALIAALCTAGFLPAVVLSQPIASGNAPPAAQKASSAKPAIRSAKSPARPRLAPTAASALPGEVLVTPRAGESLKELVIRVMQDAGDLEHVARLNRLSTAVSSFEPGTRIRVPLDRMRTVPETAVVLSTGAGVQRLGAAGAAVELQAGAVLSEGTRLRSPAGAGALLRLPDESRLQLPPASELTLTRMQRVIDTEVFRIEVDLGDGGAEAQVRKDRAAGSLFNVRTRYAVSGVRGTTFRVSQLAAASGTEVIEGGVALAGRAGAVEVPGGAGSVVDERGQPSAPVALLPAPQFAQPLPRYETVSFAVRLPAVTGAVAYRARLVQAASGGVPLPRAQVVTREPVAVFDGLPDGDYTLVVRGIDARGLEGFEASAPLTLKARPVPPIKQAPAADAEHFGGPVQARFTEPAGVSRFRAQLVRIEGERRVPVTETTLASPQWPIGDLPAGRYEWRLGSIAGTPSAPDFGPWGEWTAFAVVAAPPAASVGPDTDEILRLSWGGDAQVRYVVELAEDERFARGLRRSEVQGTRLALPRPTNGTYFVRVRRAVEGAAWSPAQRFVLERPVLTGTGVPLSTGDGQRVDTR
jgi:hypothetical protein